MSANQNFGTGMPQPAQSPAAAPAAKSPAPVTKTDADKITWYNENYISNDVRVNLQAHARGEHELSMNERIKRWCENTNQDEATFRQKWTNALMPPVSQTDENGVVWYSQKYLTWGERMRIMAEEQAMKEAKEDTEEEEKPETKPETKPEPDTWPEGIKHKVKCERISTVDSNASQEPRRRTVVFVKDEKGVWVDKVVEKDERA